MRSGLVQLMDSLCSLSGQRECSSNEKQTKKQKVATMAWAAFQVLANRCIEWEKVEGILHLFTLVMYIYNLYCYLIFHQNETKRPLKIVWLIVMIFSSLSLKVVLQMLCTLVWHGRSPVC